LVWKNAPDGEDATEGIILSVKHIPYNGGMKYSQSVVTWQFREQTSFAKLVGVGENSDLSVWLVDPPPGSVTIPVATFTPSVGEVAEVCGFGSSEGSMRAFNAKLTGVAEQMTIDRPVISGDSGGALVCRGQLIGIIWGGHGTKGSITDRNGKRLPLVQPAKAWGCTPIRDLLGRLFPKSRGFADGPQPGQIARPGGGAAPPAGPPQIPIPDPTTTPTPPAPPAKVVDLGPIKERLDAIDARIDAIGGIAAEARGTADEAVSVTAQLTVQSLNAAKQTKEWRSLHESNVNTLQGSTKSIRTESMTRHEAILAQLKNTVSVEVLEAKYKEARNAGSAAGMVAGKQAAVSVFIEKVENAKFFSLGRTLATAFGFGGPLGLGAGLAGWFIGRRVRKRVRGRLGGGDSLAVPHRPPQPPPPPVTPPPAPQPASQPQQPPDTSGESGDRIVVVDAIPPEPNTVIEQHFQPIETDSYRKAHAWARSHMARRYPGTLEALETEQSLIDQYLAGLDKDKD